MWAPMAVVDMGETYTAAWSPYGELIAEPSVVAVDARSRPLAHGMAAMEAGAGLVHPFGIDGVRDASLAAAHLRWALRRCGLATPAGTVVVLPLPSGIDDTERESWYRLVTVQGGTPVVIERPVAAALGLGLDIDAEVATLVMELHRGRVEVAVVADGGVLADRVLHFEAARPEAVAATIRNLLMSLDPDVELDVRDRGVRAHGPAAATDAWEVAELVGIPLEVGCSDGTAVMAGARRVMAETVPALLGRRFP